MDLEIRLFIIFVTDDLGMFKIHVDALAMSCSFHLNNDKCKSYSQKVEITHGG